MCSGEEGLWNHRHLTTAPKSTSPHPLPTCISLPAVASPPWVCTATKGPGHDDTHAAELPARCSSSPGPSCEPASLGSSVVLIFPVLEGACGPSHSRFVPMLHFSWEPRSHFVVKVLARGRWSHGVTSAMTLLRGL